MSEEPVDFSKFKTYEEAEDAWLEPSLSTKVAVNKPRNPDFDLNQEPSSSTNQEPTQEHSTSTPPPTPSSQEPSPPLPPASVIDGRAVKRRRQMKEDAIDPLPFQWATDRRGKLHSLQHLINNLGITSISGEVKCKSCKNIQSQSVSFDLESKFREVESFVEKRGPDMKGKAPQEWMTPRMAEECSACKCKIGMVPVVAEKKRDINWLFLFLGQCLGVCTVNQLRWLCKQNYIQRVSTKDEVLYSCYFILGKQLDPNSNVFK